MELNYAKTDKDKEVRVNQITASAQRLFLEKEYNDISVQEIITSAGMAKGSFYNYFKTKEELFLFIFESEIEAWFGEIEKAVTTLSKVDAKAFAYIIADSITQRPLFLKLTKILHPVLEQNVSMEKIYHFKKNILSKTLALSDVLIAETNLFKNSTEVLEFLFYMNALVIGLYQMSEPTKEIQKVLEHEDLSLLKMDFKALLVKSLKIFLSKN